MQTQYTHNVFFEGSNNEMTKQINKRHTVLGIYGSITLKWWS